MTFKIGDIVQLKSGGPRMTVTALPDVHDRDYTVVWFSDPKFETAYLPSAALISVDTLMLAEALSKR